MTNSIILINYSASLPLLFELEKQRFLKYILLQCSLDLPFWTEEPLSVQGKILLRNLLLKQSIYTEESSNELFIYLQKQLIGAWRKPIVTVKKDESKPLHKQMYFEIKTDIWSVFDVFLMMNKE